MGHPFFSQHDFGINIYNYITVLISAISHSFGNSRNGNNLNFIQMCLHGKEYSPITLYKQIKWIET